MSVIGDAEKIQREVFRSPLLDCKSEAQTQLNAVDTTLLSLSLERQSQYRR
jgi:hypothetical protein